MKLPLITFLFGSLLLMSETITVLTFNVCHGNGMDKRVDLSRAAKVIKQNQPLFAAVQEVDRFVSRSNKADEPEAFKNLIGYKPFFGKSIPLAGGEYGNLVLAQKQDAEFYDHIPLPGKEARSFIAVKGKTPEGHEILFVSTHFCLSNENRMESARILNEWVAKQPYPVILMGDFNCEPGSAPYKELATVWQPAWGDQPQHTFSSTQPQICIDHTFLYPAHAWKVKSMQVIEDTVTSDHRPVRVELELDTTKMNETIKLWNNRTIKTEQQPPSITTYLVDDTLRPAILVIPGGGYGGVCESTEGYAIARRFNDLGYHAFVLNYRCRPHRFPEPQQDAMRAMKIIRGRAAQWHVIPDQIAACGFSAGGHLTACLGTLQNENIDASDQDEFDTVSPWADALIMGYPVISLQPWSNKGTAVNLLGDKIEELRDHLSLDTRVTEQTPPAFIWATFTDQIVPYKNAMIFANAMAAVKRPCELHIFPFGDHGMLLGIDTFDVGQWTLLARNFLRTQYKRQQLLNSNDAEGLKAFNGLYTNPVQAKLEPPR